MFIDKPAEDKSPEADSAERVQVGEW